MEEKNCNLEQCNEDRAYTYSSKNSCHHHDEEEQTHVHEFLGSTRLAEEEEDRHNHRFAGVTDEVIEVTVNGRRTHIHRFCTRTDFLQFPGEEEGHFHFVKGETGIAIPVGEGKHVHFVPTTLTTENDGHRHEFIFATLIENPIAPREED